MLVDLNTVMAYAEDHKIAIGSFNVPNLESIQAVTEAAEELHLPVILQHAQCHEEFNSLDVVGPIMLQFARKASVPVCVHLDHGEDLNYLRRALEMGFTSIMYDGSMLSYEENCANTKAAVELAKLFDASVEAELGSMGRRESGAGDGSGADDETKIYTDPALAKEFVKSTGIDALACSFGTTHGIYLTAPKLDFTVVEQVRQQTGNIPIVMHGGSGVSENGFRNAIIAGVRKINYFTYMDKAGGEGTAKFVEQHDNSKPLFYTAILDAARKAMKDNIKRAMQMFALSEST